MSENKFKIFKYLKALLAYRYLLLKNKKLHGRIETFPPYNKIKEELINTCEYHTDVISIRKFTKRLEKMSVKELIQCIKEETDMVGIDEVYRARYC